MQWKKEAIDAARAAAMSYDECHDISSLAMEEILTAAVERQFGDLDAQYERLAGRIDAAEAHLRTVGDEEMEVRTVQRRYSQLLADCEVLIEHLRGDPMYRAARAMVAIEAAVTEAHDDDEDPEDFRHDY
jgi:hypothetical protein